jgi:cbb3-type cytochrome oxidase subunit 3
MRKRGRKWAYQYSFRTRGVELKRICSLSPFILHRPSLSHIFSFLFSLTLTHSLSPSSLLSHVKIILSILARKYNIPPLSTPIFLCFFVFFVFFCVFLFPFFLFCICYTLWVLRAQKKRAQEKTRGTNKNWPWTLFRRSLRLNNPCDSFCSVRPKLKPRIMYC